MSEHEFELYFKLLGKFLRLHEGQQAEIADELRDHLEARLAELTASGMSRETAIHRALDEFGDAACLADHFTNIARERKRRLIMRCTMGTVAAAAAVLVIFSLFAPQVPNGVGPAPAPSFAADDAKPAAKNADVGTVAKIKSPADPNAEAEAKLDAPAGEITFDSVPVRDALTHFGDLLQVDFVPAPNLDDILNQPITMRITHAKLTGRAALKLALEQAELHYTVRDGVLQIQHGHDAEMSVLLIPIEPSLVTSPDFNKQLMDVVQKMVRPESWSEVGGLGTAGAVDSMLIVRNTPEVLEEVEQFVRNLEIRTLEIRERERVKVEALERARAEERAKVEKDAADQKRIESLKRGDSR